MDLFAREQDRIIRVNKWKEIGVAEVDFFFPLIRTKKTFFSRRVKSIHLALGPKLEREI